MNHALLHVPHVITSGQSQSIPSSNTCVANMLLGLRISNNNDIEKVHLHYLRYILSVKKSTPNICYMERHVVYLFPC